MTTMVRGDAAERSFVLHEHHELTRGLIAAHDLACDAPRIATPELTERLIHVMRWFDHTMRPHLAWEETWLYPEIERRAETTWLTRLLAADHAAMRTAADRLHADHDRLILGGAHPAAIEIAGHLFALEALIRAHTEREERFILPLLENEAPRTR